MVAQLLSALHLNLCVIKRQKTLKTVKKQKFCLVSSCCCVTLLYREALRHELKTQWSTSCNKYYITSSYILSYEFRWHRLLVWMQWFMDLRFLVLHLSEFGFSIQFFWKSERLPIARKYITICGGCIHLHCVTKTVSQQTTYACCVELQVFIPVIGVKLLQPFAVSLS
mgnify:CR=1 FL=1